MATDNLGRDVGGGMNSPELKGIVASLAKGKVGEAKPFNKTASNQKDNTNSVPKELSKKFDDMAKLLKDFVKNFKTGRGGVGGATIKDPTSIKSQKMMMDLAKKGLKKGSIYTHDVYLEKAARVSNLELKAMRLEMKRGKSNDDRQMLAAALNEIVEVNKEMTDYLSRSSSKSAEGEKSGADAEYMAKINNDLIPLQLMEKLGNSAADLQETLFGFKGRVGVIFEDLFAQERDFTIEARQAAFEIGGITKESRGLQRAFEDIGKSAAETGFGRTVYQKAYLSNLKKGVKDQKLSESITKKQLNTEKMIGVEAGALDDTFLNMSLQMKMSNNEMSEFGRGIQEVARNTGVTGENLAQAVKSSEGIIKNMRNAGNLNAEAASNVVGLMASFKKFGVSEAGEEVASTLSKGMAGFFQADGGMQLLLTRIAGGNMDKIYDGTLLNTKAGLKQAAKGMEDLISEFSGGQVRTREDFEKLSDFQKQQLNYQLQASPLKKSAGELFGMMDGFNEQGASLSEKLEKINKERGRTLTLEGKANLIEQERTLKANAALEALTKFDVASKGVSNMGEALAKVDMGEMSDDLKAMGIETTDAKVAMRETMKASIAGVNESLKKAGKTQLKISDKSLEEALNDPKALSEMTAGLSKAAAEAGVGQKSQLDVTSELNQSMIELNETLRGTTQGAISSMLSSVFGKALGILTTLMSVGGMFASFVFGSFVQYHGLKLSLDKLSEGFSSFSTKIPKFRDILKTTSKIGDSLRENIVGVKADFSKGKIGKKGLLDMAEEKISNLWRNIWGEKADLLKGKIGKKGLKGIVLDKFKLAKENFQNSPFFKSMSDFFKKTSFYKGFNRARIAGDSFVDSLKRGFSGLFKQSWYWSKGKAISGFNSGFKMLKTGFSGALGFMAKKTSSLIPAIKGVFSGGVVGAVKGLFTGGAGGLIGAFKGFGTLLSGGMKMGLKGGMMALRATLLGSTLGLAQIAFSAIDGIFGAFNGFQKTGERFEGVLSAMGKSTNDLTWGMYASSTISGALVGILDGLTFGLLRMSGAAEFLETWISLSTYVLFSFVEGVVDGLMYGIGLVKPAFTALYDTFASLGESLLGLFNSITSIFGAKESKTMSAAFATIYPILKTIGWFVGMIVGAPIGAVLWTIVKVIQVLVWVIKLAVDAITGIVNIVKWAFNGIVDFLWNLGSALLSPFKWLYNVLVGNSIVPDLVSEIIMFFATLPIEIMKGLLKLPFMVGGAILGGIESIFGLVPGAIGSALYSAASAVGMGWLFDKIAGTKGGKSVGAGEAANKEAEATGGAAEAVGQTLDPSIKLLSEALIHGAETIYLSSMAARLASMPLPLGLIGGGITSGLSSLMGGSTTGSVASTAPSTSIDERVQRDLATTEPSVSSVGGPELGSIAVDGKTQVEKLTEMVGLLTEMVMIMQQSSSGSGGQEGASTLTNYVATSPPKYYKWSTGKHNQTANKGIANIANIG
jgi:hypothetical protein